MLKNKLEYAVIKLISGEEVIGKVEEDNETTIVIRNPRTLVVQQTPQGPSAGLAPVMQLADPDAPMPIMKSAIVTIMPIMAEVKDDYVRATSSVIQPATAEKSLII